MAGFTSRLGIRLMTDSRALQPGGGGVIPVGGGSPALNTGGYNDLAEAVDGGLIRRVVVELDNAVVAVTDALAYGSLKILDLADSNYIIFGAEIDSVCVKDGTGIGAALTPSVAVGTAAASNSTLSGAMINVLNIVQLAGTASAAFDKHSNDNTAPALIFLDDAATNGIWLNAAVNPAADGTLTVTGTFVIYLLDLGNLTS